LDFSLFSEIAQQSLHNAEINDSNTPLHLMKPEYNIPYIIPEKAQIKAQLDKILVFLENATPTKIIDATTREEITDYRKTGKNSTVAPGQFRLVSYEWGVTYAAMLSAAKITGDRRYLRYVADRFRFLGNVAPYFEKQGNGIADAQMRKALRPASLDDAGAMCAAMIKASAEGIEFDSEAFIGRYINYIINREYRLADGTFARNRPQHNSVWLDDMFMSIPAIANMGKYSNENNYYDEALRQIRLFKEKMWLPEKKLFRHGWVEAMDFHPSFHWARANGWAILTLMETLDALPDNYPARGEVLELFRMHAQGLLAYQSGEGFWHQLLDRTDSYLETSATAIYTCCFAHGINKGWLDAGVFSAAAVLGWNAVQSKINAQGEVEGTCVGTGMAFDPAFYYYRPVHKYAAHGYGPVIWAGAEIIELLNRSNLRMNDNAIQHYNETQSTDNPIFSIEQ
jgi:rhamnogalacturonyl hydrolase YesR